MSRSHLHAAGRWIRLPSGRFWSEIGFPAPLPRPPAPAAGFLPQPWRPDCVFLSHGPIPRFPWSCSVAGVDRPLVCSSLGLALLSRPLAAQAPSAGPDIASRDAAGLAAYDKEAADAQARGATHLSVTTGLPPALWEFDSPGDPYPAWYVAQQSFLKIFTPKELQPYVDQAWASRTAALVVARCQILQKYGLKGIWNSDEPQELPEAFFQAHPELRGPRVDQPNRARVPRFAPSVDEPETLRLYRDALQASGRSAPRSTPSPS